MRDFSWDGYEWVDFSDADQEVISFLRKGEGRQLLFVHHFSPEYREYYGIPLKKVREIVEVFNTDATQYGGSNQLNQKIALHEDYITIRLAPLSTMIFEVRFK